MLAGTVTVPSAFTTSPDPTGTVLDVICTFPAAVPTTTGLPFKVSLLVNAVVVPPGNPLTAGVVSVTATIIFMGVGVTLEVLFPGVGSASLAAILALLVYVPEALTVAMIDKVAFAPLAKVPMAQIPVPLV